MPTQVQAGTEAALQAGRTARRLDHTRRESTSPGEAAEQRAQEAADAEPKSLRLNEKVRAVQSSVDATDYQKVLGEIAGLRDHLREIRRQREEIDQLLIDGGGPDRLLGDAVPDAERRDAASGARDAATDRLRRRTAAGFGADADIELSTADGAGKSVGRGPRDRRGVRRCTTGFSPAGPSAACAWARWVARSGRRWRTCSAWTGCPANT